VKDFRDLKVWEEAHLLTLEVYGVTAKFPREELFGLTSQMHRSSVSIGANIRVPALSADRGGLSK